MKLKQGEVNRLYLALLPLVDVKLPLKKALAISNTVKTLEEHFKFGAKEEGKILNEYGAEPQPNGLIKFKDDTTGERRDTFMKEINNLNNFEVEVDIKEKIFLTEEDLLNTKLSATDVGVLSETIVVFEFD